MRTLNFHWYNRPAHTDSATLYEHSADAAEIVDTDQDVRIDLSIPEALALATSAGMPELTKDRELDGTENFAHAYVLADLTAIQLSLRTPFAGK